ncbi:transporter [Mucilaginibacter sp. PPCGB 2223]|nr:transporter [Mucilaginibacter sp. PPCGB 2223]
MILMVLFGKKVYGQSPTHLSIEDAYQRARLNYPLIKQNGLIDKTAAYTVANASKGYLPSLSFSGQATYQSTVTNFPLTIPIPGFSLPSYNKDQYKIYAEADQLIYDGGAIQNTKQMAQATQMIQCQNLEAELYNLYDRVNQLFFGVLLINEQLRQNELLKKDIENGIDKTTALVKNGTAYRSSVDELSAQLLQVEQARTELKSTKGAFLLMLAQFTGINIDENTIIEKPGKPALVTGINRPELLALDYQKLTYALQAQSLKVQLRPKFGFFIQGGYGRPGLNFLNNNFAWYYLGGLKFSWNLGSLYTYKNQRELLSISIQGLDVQKETFLFNTTLELKQQSAAISKYDELIEKDRDIISLRERVKGAAAAQLENGVLTAHDYITQVNADDQARQSFILHRIQLLQAQFSYQNTSGITTDH